MRIACLLKWFYGVSGAQEILVLLETVRFSLELLNSFFLYLNYIHTCMTACESSSTKKCLICTFLGACFYLVLTFISQLLATSR